MRKAINEAFYDAMNNFYIKYLLEKEKENE